MRRAFCASRRIFRPGKPISLIDLQAPTEVGTFSDPAIGTNVTPCLPGHLAVDRVGGRLLADAAGHIFRSNDRRTPGNLRRSRLDEPRFHFHDSMLRGRSHTDTNSNAPRDAAA